MKSKQLVIPFSIIIIITFSFFVFSRSNNSQKTNLISDVYLEEAFPNLIFKNPIDFQVDNVNDNIVYIAEQTGRIVSLINNNESSSTKLLLDITNKVLSGGERGLLGLAFHPNFSSNGFFYVDYTSKPNGTTTISRFEVINDFVDINTEFVILEVPQPYSNHNAGQIIFGLDGYLYITLGDGGGGGDPSGNGQNLKTLLGSILRIDIDHTSSGKNYSIPSDNPYNNNSFGYREEIFAHGFRNPWRMSLDSVTGNIWIGDVGQNKFEEIDILVKGKNYGWNTMEGNSCFSSNECNMTNLQKPIYDYDRSDGYAVTGGYVYRGNIKSLQGMYIFGDYGSGKIWYLNSLYEKFDLFDSGFTISSFGVDAEKNLYVFDYSHSKVYKFSDTVTSNSKGIISSTSNSGDSPSNTSKPVISFSILSQIFIIIFLYLRRARRF
jgi:glucose/arabinose dehydrogenase